MVDTTQSPLAMLVLITPYTLIYLVNHLFLNGILDGTHFVFFELIFVLAFRKVFGLPDLSERLFPAQVGVQSVEAIRPAKTALLGDSPSSSSGAVTKKKVKKSKKASSSSSSGLATTTVTKKVVKKEAPQPYAREMVAMEKRFMDYVNNTTIWEKVFEETSPELIQVYQYKERPMCYKIIAVMNNTPAVVFDLLSDISKRPDWDPLCVEAKTIAEVAPGTKVQYMRTKGMWPTASRDTVVLGTVKDLGEGRFCNYTTSVEHPGMPERVKEKFVRMETSVAGQIIEPLPVEAGGGEGVNKCRVVQILDADLKGWIPEKVIQMVSTKAVPEGMRNVNNLTPTLTPYTESKVLERVKVALQAAEAAKAQRLANGEEEEEEEEEETVSGQDLKDNVHSLRVREATTSSMLTNGNRHANGNGHGKKGGRREDQTSVRMMWESVKDTFGFRTLTRDADGAGSMKGRRIMVATLVLATLGPVLARYRRRRR